MKSRKWLIPVILGSLLALILIMGACGGGNASQNDPKDALEACLNAFLDKDASKFLEFLPKKMIDAYCDDLDLTRKEFTKELQEFLEDSIDEELEDYEDLYGKGKLKFVAGKKTRIKGDDLDDIKEDYADEYDIKVQDAAYVTYSIEYKIRGGDTKTVEDDDKQLMIKVDGKWYLGDFPWG